MLSIETLKEKREEMTANISSLESSANALREQLAQAERNAIACRGAAMVLDQLIATNREHSGDAKPDGPAAEPAVG